MAYEFIILESDPQTHIARITLNRPEKMNAHNPGMMEEIKDAIDLVEMDDDLKVLIFRGTGKSFCSGGDLGQVGRGYGWKEPKPGEKERRPSIRRRLTVDKRSNEFFQKIFYCSKATIAQVHGYAIGGGFHIALMCDMCIASDDAKFGHPGVRIVGPGYHQNTLLWILRLGVTLAKELDFTGRLMSADEAYRRNVINQVVPLDQLEGATNKMAETLAQIPADGVVMGKFTFNLLFDMMGVRSAFDYGAIAHTLGTNIRYEPDEVNFFKSRRDKGATAAMHEKDERFRGRMDSDARFSGDKDAQAPKSDT
ncbi:MAG: enoyl-CoA hydratase/isomerase family protein [Chloroflexi bacterium]|nr:enoyl-CoA hydratase/isomerase family protein [Chloroflexota bacterium]